MNIEETLKQHLLYLESGGASGTEADLSFANLSFANLREADRFLTARIDPRGFELKIWKEKDGVWVSSGCKTMPLQEAKTHWGKGYSPSCGKDKVGSIDIGKRYLDTINFLATLL